MKTNRAIVSVMVLTALLICATGWTQTSPTFRPLPPGVIELTHVGGTDGGIVELKDGSLLAQGSEMVESGHKTPIYRISKDGGKTWGEPQPLKCDAGAAGMIRLKSGTLAVYGKRGDGWYFSSSSDDGTTWTPATLITNYPSYRPMFHSLIQLSSGRLLLSGYWEGFDANPPPTLSVSRGRVGDSGEAKCFSWRATAGSR